MVPVADDLVVPTETPVNIPTLSETKTLGTVLGFAEELETHTKEKLTEFKINPMRE